MRRITLDTNAYAALHQGILPVRQAIEKAEEVFVPIFVYAELLFGFRKGSRESENTSLFSELMKLPGVSFHYPTDETARIYTDILLGLKRQGTPIPAHDIWIAASAVETGSVIITYDKHFLNIAQVRAWDELSISG